jgi:bifunctional non-homologous end joining protein LigD
MFSMTMIKPMLVAAGPLPRDSGRCAHEVKYDGFRALVQASPGGVTITCRNGYDFSSRYPELGDDLSHAVSTPVLLDGEIVALYADGSSADWPRTWDS